MIRRTSNAHICSSRVCGRSSFVAATSFGFIPIGKLSNRLLKDASDAMSKDEKDEKIEDKEEK